MNRGVNTITLKKKLVLIAELLAHNFNKIIDIAIGTDVLKIAEFVRIHKSGNKRNSSNYRPISLISYIKSRKNIYNRINNFIKKHKIINDTQFGIVQKKRTRDALGVITKK